MALYSRQWKPDSNTQISPRNPNTVTWQGSTGGTTIKGGTVVGDDLILNPNSVYDYNNSGSGFLRLLGRIRNGDSYTATQVPGVTISYSQTITQGLDAAAPRFISYNSAVTAPFNASLVSESGMGGAGLAVDAAGSATKTASGTDLVNSLCKFQCFETRHLWQYNNASAGGTQIVGGYQSAHGVRAISTGTATIDLVYGFGWSSFTGQPNPDAGGTRPNIVNPVGTSVTVSRLVPFWAPDMGYTGTVNELYQFYGEDQTDAVATRVATLRSRMNISATKFGLYFDGDANSVHLGGMSFGDLTQPGTGISLRTAAKVWISDTATTTPSTAVWNLLTLNDDSNSAGQNTINVLSGGTLRGILLSGHANYAAGNPAGAAANVFLCNMNFNPGANSRAMLGVNFFNNTSAISTAGFTGITATVRSIQHTPVIGDLAGSGTGTFARIVGLNVVGSILEPATGTITVNDYNAIYMNPPSIVGTPVLDRLVCVDIENFGSVGTTQATIWAKGDMPLCHEGPAVFGISQATSPVAPVASIVHIGGAGTAASSIRINTSAAPTSPGAGDIWHDSTQLTLRARLATVTQSLEGVLATQTTSVTVANTTTETTLVGTLIGTDTTAANGWAIGKNIRITAWGYLSTTGLAPTLNMRVRYGGIGGTVAVATGANAVTGAFTNNVWKFTADVTCRTTGAGGTVFSQGSLLHQAGVVGAQLVSSTSNTGTTAIDTTAAQQFVLSAQWGTANASNTITCSNFTIEVLN